MNKFSVYSKIILLILFILRMPVYAGNNNIKLKSQAAEWIHKQSNKGFLENRGQMIDMEGKAVPHVLFKTEAPELNFWITEQGITIQTLKLRKELVPENELSELDKQEALISGKAKTKKYFDWERIDIELKGGSIKKENIIKENPLQGHQNYFYPHCSEGIYEVKEYEKITIQDVYPNIDWVFYRKADGTLKYDFVVHPGGDYAMIELIYKSKTPVAINESGELELYTKHGNVKENTPVSFYNGETVPTQFKLKHQQPITINGDNGYETSIKFSLPIFNLQLPTSNLIIDPQLTWATFYGGSGVDGPVSIDADINGNIFITGYTGGNTNFPVLNSGTYFQGSTVIGLSTFILKFNNNGVRLWATFYGIANGNYSSVVTDNAGNVFVAGSTSSTTFPTQNAGTYYDATIAGGASKLYILKFDNNGNRLWATLYGANGNNGTTAYSIACDGTGNIFITGAAYGANFPTLNTGTYHQAANTTTGNSGDAFVLKFSNAGVRLWATVYGGSSLEIGYSITCDPSGNLFIAGLTNSTDLPTQNAGTFFQGTYAGNNDCFILKFSNNGARLWATYYGGSDAEATSTIKTDLSGNVFFLGRTASNNLPTQNAGTYFDGTLGGTGDVFILKFSNNGTRLWATYYGGSNFENTSTWKNIAIDNCGTVYFCFETRSNDITTQAACDGGYQNSSYNGGWGDQFVVRFSNYGVLLWATYLGGNKDDFRSPIALDKQGNLFITGEWTKGTGGGNITASTYPLTNPGGGAYYAPVYNGGVDDGMIVKFNKTLPLITPATNNASCVCDGSSTITVSGICNPVQYAWKNSAWTTISNTSSATNLCPGNYAAIVNDTINCNTDTAYVAIATAQGGAVSIINNVNMCAGGNYILPDGSSVNTSGIYSHTFVSASGCDSIITTNLTIGSPINTYDTIHICTGQSVSIHGINQNTTSVYTHTFIALGGCDSISSVALFINPIASNTISVNSCNAYSHNGISYTSSGIYTQTLLSAAGCDSLLTIDVTINIPSSSTNSVTICSGQTTLIHGVSTNTAGLYTQTFVAANGCDSISAITLFVNGIISNSITINTCNNYNHNGTNYTTSGIYTQTLTSTGTCDSLLVIDLTINMPVTTVDSISICQGQATIIHGVNTNTSGIYTQTFVGRNGCDSISSVTLTIIPNATNTIQMNSCGAYIHNGITYTTSGTYTQTLANGTVCDSILTIILTIDTIQTSDTIFICEGEKINIHNTTQYQSGTYVQHFLSSNGCDSVSSVILKTHTRPVSSFAINPNPAETNTTIHYLNQSIGANQWNWSFGDVLGSSSSQQNPTFLYNDSGHYQIQLIVFNEYGCSDTSAQQLYIEPQFVFYAPNTFTPDGDDINDQFLPKGMGIDANNYELYIFDRWGNQIFKSTNLHIGWDGRANGGTNIAQIDTYVWLVVLKDVKGITHRYIGHVNLLR